MTKVLVDLLFMTGAKGGMETYVREVYSRIAHYLPDVAFVGLASRELAQSGADWFPGELIDSKISGANRLKWALTESFLITRFARKHEANIIHSPANFGSWSAKVPSVVTVHDLLSFENPKFLPGKYASILRLLLRNTVKAASCVLTVSEASARDMQKHLGLPIDRISVAPLAAIPQRVEGSKIKQNQPFLLSVGNNLPHKNLELLLDALEAIPPSVRPRLIFTGGNAEPLRKAIRSSGLKDWAEHRGWVSEAELEALYANALALVLPTRFEGFGLPVLEAMQRGCPVICSDIPVLREVGGNAALFVDTSTATGITHAIQECMRSEELRDNLIAEGIRRSREFSWDKTSQMTAQTLGAILNASQST